MEQTLTSNLFGQIMNRIPDAVAFLRGSAEYPDINGVVYFWQTNKGAVVAAEINGLPRQKQTACEHPLFALHIHEGYSCTGDAKDPFANAGAHYNPENCMHPAHAGDLPPLFSNGGRAWMAVLTDRFAVHSVIGRTVIIHSHADDFMTQPSGAAGSKIACGIICAIWRESSI